MKQRLQKNRKGYTLVEVMIAVLLASLIFVTVIMIFTTVTQSTLSTQSELYASSDANTGMQRVIESTHAAGLSALPGETGFTALSGYTNSAFQTTDSSGSTVYTGLMLTFPAVNSTSITFPGCTNAVSVFDRTTAGTTMLYYRSDANGTPDASAGTCLWEYGTMNGTAYNQSLMKSVSATTSNSIQFMRPTVSLQNEIEVKIVSSYYSPINKTASNEALNGTTTTTLTGDAVMTRNSGTGAWATQTATTSGGVWHAGL
jgi:prepilin-type N-terminal cleavage/methylation domain-containing protein